MCVYMHARTHTRTHIHKSCHPAKKISLLNRLLSCPDLCMQQTGVPSIMSVKPEMRISVSMSNADYLQYVYHNQQPLHPCSYLVLRSCPFTWSLMCVLYTMALHVFTGNLQYIYSIYSILEPVYHRTFMCSHFTDHTVQPQLSIISPVYLWNMLKRVKENKHYEKSTCHRWKETKLYDTILKV